MPDINATALQSIARMAYGSGMLEGTSGGKGNIGALMDGAGNLRVIKFNTHSRERGGPATADQIDASNNLRTQLLAIADNRGIDGKKLTELKKLLGVGENNEIPEGAPLMTRKVAAKAVKLIDANVFREALKGVDLKQLSSDKRTTTISEAVKDDYKGAVNADDVKLISDKVNCFNEKCDALIKKRNYFFSDPTFVPHDFYYRGKGADFNVFLNKIRSVVTEDIKGRRGELLTGIDADAIEKKLDEAVARAFLAYGRKDLAIAYLSTSSEKTVTEQEFDNNPVFSKFSEIVDDAKATAGRFEVSAEKTEKMLTDLIVESLRQDPLARSEGNEGVEFAKTKMSDVEAEKFVNDGFCKIADENGDRDMRDIIDCQKDAETLFKYINNDIVLGKNGLNLKVFSPLIRANLHLNDLSESTNEELQSTPAERRHHMEGVGRLLVKQLETVEGGKEKLEAMKKALLENEENLYPFGLFEDSDAAGVFNGMLDGLGFHRTAQVETAYKILDVVVSRVKTSFVELQSITEPPNDKAAAQKDLANLKAYYGETDESIRKKAIQMLNELKHPFSGDANYLRSLTKLDFTDVKKSAEDIQKIINANCKKINKSGKGNLGVFNDKFLQICLREFNSDTLLVKGTGVNICGKIIYKHVEREDKSKDYTLNSEHSGNASINEQIRAIFEALNDKVPAELLPAVCLVCSSNGSLGLTDGPSFRNDFLVGGDDWNMPYSSLMGAGLMNGGGATVNGIEIKQGEDGWHVTTTVSNSFKMQSIFGKVDVHGGGQIGLFNSSYNGMPTETMVSSNFIKVEVVIPEDWSVDNQTELKVVGITGKQVSGEQIDWKA